MEDKVMKERLQTMSTVELIQNLTTLERQIQLAILMFDEYHDEIKRRYPNIRQDDIDLKIMRKKK